jgi:glutaminyl-peptide cyclotransferase
MKNAFSVRTGPLRASLTLLLGIAIGGCAQPNAPSETASGTPAGPSAPFYGFLAVNSFPHDRDAFTQGLIYRDGFLYESTGLNGRSSLRKVELDTGKVLQRRDVDPKYFAEGLTDWDGRLVQLTWQTNVGFVYDLAKFDQQRTFMYSGEGWGLTHDDTRLIMSDGTARLRFLDPDTLAETGGIDVTDGGRPIERLNELEFVNGEVYANVWQTERIAIIAPDSGHVTAWLDLTGLHQAPGRQNDDVMNGIAYDAAGDRLFVTGKLWPQLFQIRVRK